MLKKLFLFLVLLSLVFSLAACKTAEEGNLPPEPMKPGEEAAANAPVGQVYKAAEFLDAEQNTWAANPGEHFKIEPEEMVVFMLGEDEKNIMLTAQNDQYIYNTFLYAEDPAPGEEVDIDNLWKEKLFTEYSNAERIGSSNWLPGLTPIVAKFPLSKDPARKRFFLTYGCSETAPKDYDLNERYVWDDAKDCHGEGGSEGKWMAHLLYVKVITDLDSAKDICVNCGLDWIGGEDGYCCGDDVQEAFIQESGKSNCCQYSFFKIDPADGQCLPQEPCTDPQDAVACKAEVEEKMDFEDMKIKETDWEAVCELGAEGEGEGEPEQMCGNNVVEGDEVCDGSDLGQCEACDFETCKCSGYIDGGDQVYELNKGDRFTIPGADGPIEIEYKGADKYQSDNTNPTISFVVVDTNEPLDVAYSRTEKVYLKYMGGTYLVEAASEDTINDFTIFVYVFLGAEGEAEGEGEIEMPDVKATDKSSPYYGTVSGVVGDVVTAEDPDGIICGAFRLTADGEYGLMSVYGDDALTTDIDEGAKEGDEISFFLNGMLKTTGTWTSAGSAIEVNLG